MVNVSLTDATRRPTVSQNALQRYYKNTLNSIRDIQNIQNSGQVKMEPMGPSHASVGKYDSAIKKKK